ncbi:MAG: response regulator [Deltaproteobacteria bacterium]|nr:response regulator [Deltaproteobacteria bacterium]
MMTQNKRSISRALTVTLISTVVAVSVITVTLIYHTISQRAKAQLEEKADEYIISLAGVLEIPLWDLDERNIIRTGQAFTQNELVEMLKITNSMGDVYFDFKRESQAPLVSRTRKILHEGQFLGNVEISLTTKYDTEINRQLLLSGMGTLSVVILVLVVATGFLLRMLLNKPLDCLAEIANAYASGRYDPSGYDMLFLEFQPLVGALAEMGDKITSQMTELRNAEKKYRGIFENAVEGIFQSIPEGRFLNVNPSMARILGYDSAEELIENIADIGQQLYVNPGQRETFIQQMRDGKTVSGFHVQMYCKNRRIVWVSLHARPVLNENGQLLLTEGILEDITEPKRVEAERIKLEDQLRQSQKMETVGLLAGGIAHDFNNLLTPILGYCELLIAGFPEEDPRRQKLQHVWQAAERAKDLTHRLLAFSRKQMIELKTVDLGALIRQFESMLRRTIRESIHIEVRISPSIGLVRADARQIEQILINLSINAQDAMPEGGTLTIEAADIDLDESYTSSHPEIAPGAYVMLAISDTGVGMDEETMEHIFDPFFTTKELGRGTGLGLSTVYGIVKQHGGSISVYSEKNQGSIFKTFLPRTVTEGAMIEAIEPLPDELAHGDETILLVEDNEMVRMLACTMLQSLGYQVIVAENPDQCTKLAGEHKSPISLLLTDVVMPGMNGRDLFDRLRLSLPDLKVLFMSGYTSNVIMHHGVVDEGMHFIQKPFSMHTLSQKVRHVLVS